MPLPEHRPVQDINLTGATIAVPVSGIVFAIVSVGGGATLSVNGGADVTAGAFTASGVHDLTPLGVSAVQVEPGDTLTLTTPVTDPPATGTAAFTVIIRPAG